MTSDKKIVSNISKWFPKSASLKSSSDKIFSNAKILERELLILGNKLTHATKDVNLLDPAASQSLLTQCKVCLQESCLTQFKLSKIGSSGTERSLDRSTLKLMLCRKSTQMRKSLRRRHFQLLYIISKTIKMLLGEGMFEKALNLVSLFNDVLIVTSNYMRASSGTQICSNTFTNVVAHPKPLDISTILQLVTRYKTESCCASLISCLLANCRAEMMQLEDNESDTSSLLVYQALTIDLPYVDDLRLKNSDLKCCIKQKPETMPASNIDDPAIDFFNQMSAASVDRYRHRNENTTELYQKQQQHNKTSEENEILMELIRTEEIFIAQIIAKSLKLCPSAFTDLIVTKIEIMRLIEKASRFLWTQVATMLEHAFLWWNSAPLACRPVACTKYLREWLLLQCDAPEPILSTLRGLGEILTIHTAGCLWDKQFRNCLVLSSGSPHQIFDRNSEFFTPSLSKGTECGYFWSELFQTLVTLTNSCDRSGTIASELPLTEQIPVLHRLDHSIHTYRLWMVTKAKEFCSRWSLVIFFKLVHDDMEKSIKHLNDLRLPALVCENPLLEVHSNVNVALREKLVSEVKENREKAKLTTSQCINHIFALVCEQTSLATLKIYFPPLKIFRINHLRTTHNQYIDAYLDIIYLPVIEATKDLEILRLALKIIGEALLEYIYLNRIKFSACGAINLMKDFEGIAAWINDCEQLSRSSRDKLARHEILKVCEGVAKILLRKPDEIISLRSPPKAKTTPPSTSSSSSQETQKDDEDDRADMPPEMYINQKKWLELRVAQKSPISSCCNDVNIVT